MKEHKIEDLVDVRRFPKYCHRRFISAYLESEEIKVVHIVAKEQKASSSLKFKTSKRWIGRLNIMHIREFQDMMRQIYFHHDSKRGAEGTYLWFVEEVEELGEALKGKDKKALENEFADVLAWLASLANVVNVNLEKAAMAKYNQRCPRCKQVPCKCTRNFQP